MLRLSLLLGAWSAAAFATAQQPERDSKPVEVMCEVTSQDGKPVQGAQVWLMLRPNYNQETEKDEILASGTTNASGRFSMVLAGQAQSMTRYGTVMAKKDGVGVAGAMVAYSGEGSHAFEGHIKVPLPLTPMEECRVRLLKPDGAPAAGVHVWVDECTMPADPRGFMYTVRYGVPRLQEIGWEAITDAEGRCAIPGLPQGAYLYLRHDAAGLAQLNDKHQTHSFKAPRASGQEIELRLTAGGTLRGRVTRADATRPGVCSVYLLEEHPYTTSYGEQIRTDAEGMFEFTQVPPSRYQIRYRGPLSDEDHWIGDERHQVLVEAGKVSAVEDLILTPTAIVTGRVLDADTGDKIEEPVIFRVKAGAHKLIYRMHRMGPSTHLPPGPNEGAAVQVVAGERTEVTFRLRRKKAENSVTATVLDAQGKLAAGASVAMMGGHGGDFAFPTVADEKGRVSFTVKSPQDHLSLLAWTDQAISEPTPVKAGGSAEVRLQSEGLASIRGVIRDEQGKPVAGASFEVIYDAIDGLVGGPVPEHTRVGVDGAFHIPRVPKAVKEVTLFAYADGLGKAALRDRILKPGEALEWNPVLRAVRESLAGTVVDKAGRPVPGVQIRIYGDDQPTNLKPVVTDAQGRFRVENLAAAPLRVMAQQRTAAISRDTYVSAKTPASNLRLVLPDAVGKVAGIVRDHLGKPVYGAEVNSYASDRKMVTDKAGRFAFNGVEQGWFTVEVSTAAQDGRQVRERFRIKTGMKNVCLDLRAAPTDDSEWSSAPPLDLTGKAAPEIHVATWIHTEPLAVKAGGKVRILDFWGMECGPCLAGFPKVQKFWEQHHAEGIEIIALGSGHYPKEEVQEYLQKHPGLTFPFALQPKDGRDAHAYQVRGIPTYVVIGKDGKIICSGHDWDLATAAALRAVGK